MTSGLDMISLCSFSNELESYLCDHSFAVVPTVPVKAVQRTLQNAYDHVDSEGQVSNCYCLQGGCLKLSVAFHHRA